VENLIGKDHLGTVRNRRMSVIKMDFKNTRCHNGDQLHLSHAWHQLWILVNTAIVKFFKKHKIS
jgi:hypothetical protein